jgi:hypothetical protein
MTARNILILLALSGLVKAADGPGALKQLEFLLGNWAGEASAQESAVGAGRGGYSFEPQLDGKILVRKNHSEYTSGVKHADLMIVYLEDGPHAIYFDNEGHVIRYNVTFDGARRAVFESSGPGPRYRLTYWPEGALLKGRFEIAPPGGEYKTYMSWDSKKI